MRRLPIAGAVLLTASLFASTVGASPGVIADRAATTSSQGRSQTSEPQTFVVLATEGADVDDVVASVVAAGGEVRDVNAAVGMVTAETTSADFAATVNAAPQVDGAARDSVVGSAPTLDRARDDVERLGDAERAAARKQPKPPKPPKPVVGREPLAPLQWDMDMIEAPAAHQRLIGDHRTKVAIIDTGIDGSHPDIAPNFNASLSRNFTTDIPLIDGPCEEDPDGSCEDPADVDEDGHGTHVAGTIGSPINGVGIAGVAPGVELVNLRAGQDSGYFFLGPVVNALTFAADNGIDVVNMSFYIDPWLYNCQANPADSAEEQLEQRTIVEATQRALDYATARGVTLIAAAGNGYTDLGAPGVDASSPDFPPGNERERTIDNATCLNMPTEGDGVLAVTSVGPSGRKAYYSDYGVEQADVSAPGGDYYDGTPGPTNMVLAPYPEALAVANGEIDPITGESLSDFVVADCTSGDCSYYQYLQGTSMAAPHAAGVAALVVAKNGRTSGKAGFGLHPHQVVRIMTKTASDKACPDGSGAVTSYAPQSAVYEAVCVGTAKSNGFYGEGIVDALAVVTSPGKSGR